MSDSSDKKKGVSVNDLVGEGSSKKKTQKSSSNKDSNKRKGKKENFNGVVDDRKIPDADVPTKKVKGILDTAPKHHGLLHPEYVPSNKDIYISSSQIRRFSLRPGDTVEGPARQPKKGERYWGLLKIEKVNGVPVKDLEKRPHFDHLTPIYPEEKIKLETGKDPLSTRIIDLVAPVGRGQRGLIVSPPKAGKTTILKHIAMAVAKNHPEIIIMGVLVGERPEEVTDIRRTVNGDVVASNFDEPPQRQTQVAEIAVERAKRLVEQGEDVVLLLDSITRLARAYNLSIPSSGRTLSGGFDPKALYPPKRFFGAARNIEHGGSLTILGTCLIETESRMDDLIYEEFKGTGNMELHLSRELEERRIFPAINVQKSGTRQEQLLFDKENYKKIVTMRRMIDMLGKKERTELLLQRMKKTEDNEEFLEGLNNRVKKNKK
jgi:transcription termination factor Rho